MQVPEVRNGGVGSMKAAAGLLVSAKKKAPSRSRLLKPVQKIVGLTGRGSAAAAAAAGRTGGRGTGRGRGAGGRGGRGAPVALVCGADEEEPSQRIQVSVTLTKDRSDINESVFSSLASSLYMDDR